MKAYSLKSNNYYHLALAPPVCSLALSFFIGTPSLFIGTPIFFSRYAYAYSYAALNQSNTKR